MVSAEEKHELQKEIKRLNSSLATILRDYGHVGNMIPVLKHHPIWKDNRFLELMAKRKMLFKVLSIFNLRFEEGFKLLTQNF